MYNPHSSWNRRSSWNPYNSYRCVYFVFECGYNFIYITI